MLRVATVLSAREWEARFVAAARDSAALRLVMRAYLPDEVSSQADRIDVVVAGAETPWVTATRVAAWRRLGLRVVGVHPQTDRPAADRLQAGGVDLLLEEALDPEQMVREVRLLDAGDRVEVNRTGDVVVVTGCAGAPGRTEVAIALAWMNAGRSHTALVDGDLEGPSIAIRLGLPARPDLADCVDVLIDGGSYMDSSHEVGRMRVVTGSLRVDGLKVEPLLDLVETASATARVLVDVGRWSSARQLIRIADSAVFVASATPKSIVRTSRIVDEWDGPTPALVINKVDRGREPDVVSAVRRWSGLDPAALVRRRRRIRRTGLHALEPHRALLRELEPVVDGWAA